jgi:hypothetical protein
MEGGKVFVLKEEDEIKFIKRNNTVNCEFQTIQEVFFFQFEEKKVLNVIQVQLKWKRS